MLIGVWLVVAATILAVWLVLLGRKSWNLFKALPSGPGLSIRRRLTVAGVGFSFLSVGSLFVLHLSWFSAGISQYFGVRAVEVLSALVFWAALGGLILGVAGSGNGRLLGIGASLAMGVWWYALAMEAAITMAPPLVRHPTKFLIPHGYIGWVEVRHGEKGASPLRIDEKGSYVCKIPASGVLDTSSPVEEGWAKDQYFYYTEAGSLQPLNNTGWGLGGMIWGSSIKSEQTEDRSQPTRITETFFVGTEEQYHRAVSTKSQNHR